jgi:D-amino-acid dehydrogenase
VTIIDQSDLSDGCSYGNAGMIVPSHFIPLAAPGMISKGIRWMFNSSSPFYVKPRLDFDLIKWGIQFYKHSNHRHVEKAAVALKEISLLSKATYQELSNDLPFDFNYQERGLMMLYQTTEVEHEERETAAMANDYGIDARILSLEEIQSLEPDVKVNVRGGIYFPGDAHLTPHAFMNGLKYHLKNKISFQLNSAVTDFTVDNRAVKTVKTTKGEFTFDNLVIACGSWSGDVMRKLNLNLPMQAGKGYSFTLDGVAKNIRIPSILLEGRVAVTPMTSSLRFGGTMEITGIDHSINMNRVKGIVNTANAFYPEMELEVPPIEKIWHGLRPCSPDGLPYIGRTKKFRNLILATGHSMLGVSLGPGTGKLISEIVDEKNTCMDLATFNPERFQR